MVINLAGGALLTAVGWWCREIWESIKKLKDDLQKLEVDLPSKYVPKTEINVRLDKIDSILERIFDKLDNKVDK